MRLLNFGSLNIDYVYKVDHFVRPGETLSSESLHVFSGGKGLNQSIALARAGVEVFHAGSIGKPDGKTLLEILKDNKIKTDFINEIEGIASGHAIIQVDQSGQNCIILFGGANQEITKEQIHKTLDNFSKGDYLLVQNEINLLDYIIEEAHKRGLIIVLNPSPMNEKILSSPLQYVDYFILNEIEATDICGESKVDNLLDCLAEKFPSAKIVLTLGELGVKYKDSTVSLEQGIFKVPVVDTTGAGDTFTGFFIGCLAQGYDIKDSLELASLAAAISVSRQGAEASMPNLDEVKRELSLRNELPMEPTTV